MPASWLVTRPPRQIKKRIEPAQKQAQILAAAFAEKTQEYFQLRRRQRRGRGETGVVTVFAWQHRKRDAALARNG